MAVIDRLLFVSRRASLAAAALLCLTAGRLALAVLQGAPPSPTEVRVAVRP